MGMVTLLLATPCHPLEKTLLKFPEKPELPKQCAIYQQEDIVNRQNQNVVQHTEPHRVLSIRESHVQQWFFDQ